MTEATVPKFDPITYKETTHEQWQEAAEAWHRWAPLRFERESFGALHQMLAGLDPQSREEAWVEIERELGRSQGPSGFEGPCELVVAAGTK